MKAFKIKLVSVAFNNRSKELTVVYRNGKKVVLHYGQLGLKGNLAAAGVDPESAGYALFLEYVNGKREFVPYDTPLLIVQDPDYLLQDSIENLVADIRKKLRATKISKKYLARSLKTSDIQIERLLDSRILNKNLVQLNEIAHCLGASLELSLKRAA